MRLITNDLRRLLVPAVVLHAGALARSVISIPVIRLIVAQRAPP